ncbi:hypothetical protein SAMN04488122_4892 [Chitinophaga arvensicola]|uniref:Uncharacterized protein n=1 Tax=Chitinophaga arvensicola TaxID=29529 RepID=A0A1I0S8Q7_9BACT|nr:hypothetical protein SAMN04488122_4892 [Chitinophaga arvensicola]
MAKESAGELIAFKYNERVNALFLISYFLCQNYC